MQRHLAAARQDPVSGDRARAARDAAGQCRLSLQPVLRALPRQCRPEPHRGDGRARPPIWCSTSSSGGASPRSTSPAARRSSIAHFRRLVTAARDMGVQGDGPPQPHHPGAARPGGPRRIPRRQPGRDRRLDALLPAGQCRQAARQGRVSTARSAALQRLNALGYGREGSGLTLNLVYNPLGPSLPPPQAELEADYKRVLGERFGIVFNSLFTLANMPIQRFGAILLVARASSTRYLDMLQHAHRDDNLDGVMCRNLLSVDYRGYVYDCDFNQMLDLPLARGGRERVHLSRPARRRHRRQSDPRRRPLLRLHRRPGLELRRRAEGGGGVSLGRLRLAAEASDRERRRAHLPGRLSLSALGVRPRSRSSPPTCSMSSAASTATSRRSTRSNGWRRASARRSRSCSTATFTGSMPSRDWFAEIERGVARHHAIRGNVETEIARAADIGAGCGCAYPAIGRRGHRARARTKSWPICASAATRAGHGARLAALPMHLVAQVGGLRIGIVHGDAAALAGWGFAHDALDDPAASRWLDDDPARRRASMCSPRPIPALRRCAISHCRPAA